MTDYRTTFAATITLIAYLFSRFGLDLPPDVQLAVITVGVFVIGLLAKDSKSVDLKSGDPAPETKIQGEKR